MPEKKWKGIRHHPGRSGYEFEGLGVRCVDVVGKMKLNGVLKCAVIELRADERGVVAVTREDNAAERAAWVDAENKVAFSYLEKIPFR